MHQLQEGPVLVIGAGNSGAEIALDVAKTHRTFLSGRHTGHIPFRIDGLAARLILRKLVLRFVFHCVLTVRTAIDRKARQKILLRNGPLIRVKPADLPAAGIERVPRVAGARDGLPVLDDGRRIDAANVIWCTGYQPGFSWIEAPVFEENGMPTHDSGVVTGEPGLYFVGLPFIYPFSSTMIHGFGRDAERIAAVIESRVRGARSSRRAVSASHG